MPLLTFLAAVAAGSAVRAAICCWFGDLLVTGGALQIGLAAVVLMGGGLPLLHPRVRGWLFTRMGGSPFARFSAAMCRPALQVVSARDANHGFQTFDFRRRTNGLSRIFPVRQRCSRRDGSAGRRQR